MRRTTNASTYPDRPAPVRAEITRRINAERLALLGWGRAILLQLAHPLVGAGVYEHSAFRRASTRVATRRLHATIHAMLSLTFGTDAERATALAAIRAIHQRVHGHLAMPVGPFAAGTPYSAEDPALVLWVHLTLLESVPLAYEQFVQPLSAQERDVYCAEAAWVAEALGARPEDVPRSWDTMRAQMQCIYGSGAITVGPQARELARAVLWPGLGRVVPPAGWLNRLVTIGLLPPHIREQFGFKWTARHQRLLDAATPLIRGAHRYLPDRVTLWGAARR
jgi:uncharacterized protein (DUF2236 family)